MGLTDLHLHLIPRVDDGPRSDEEAVALARQIAGDGVTRVVVTPHFNAWNVDLVSSRAEVEEHVSALRALLTRNAVELEIHPGAEHFLNPELLDRVAAGVAPPLGAGPYILVELPFDTRPLYADELLYQLSVAGLSPVLAHPDRYAWVGANPDALASIVNAGVHLQLTAPSIAGQYGQRVKRVAQHILGKGWYGLVGSDIHHSGQPRSLAVMADMIRDLAGDVVARTLFIDNPSRVLDGKPLLPVPPVEVVDSTRKLFGLF